MANKYVITVSYGDYTLGFGGTDKVILAQQSILNDEGYNVISISPFRNYHCWNVLMNGQFEGVYTNKRFKSFLSKLQGSILPCIIIHHLKSVNINLLDDILSYCNVPILFYLHDYYTICPMRGLVRENGLFCGNGFPSVAKCGNCSYFKKSEKLLSKIRTFLKKYESRITFIAPSEEAKKVWLKDYFQYINKVEVIYHQKLSGEYIGNNKIIHNEEPLKIAFIGYQKPLKGWNQYRDAVESALRLKLSEKFYQFGWGDEKLNGVEQINVDFKNSITAMTDAIRNKEIDVAVLWSIWPETYSYTYYESLVANCFILTNHLSGNVCAQVKERRNGIVVDDLKEVLCDEKRLREMVNAFRMNGHTTPNELKENEDFLKMIYDVECNLSKVYVVYDFSVILTLLKKLKIVKKKDINL